MSRFITVIFGSAGAAARAIEWDNSLIVGDGSEVLSETTVYLLTADTWQTALISAGFSDSDQLYKSVSIFFSASPIPEQVYVIAYVEGSTTEYNDIPLTKIDDETWEIPNKPPEGWKDDIKRVRFYCCEGSDEYTWNYQDGSTGIGFTELTDAEGNWTGQLEFPDGLTGEECGIVTNLTTNCKITVDFEIEEGKEKIGETITTYNISLISLALPNDEDAKNFSSNVFGVDQINDMMTMRNVIAGKNAIWFYSLPGDANPEDLILGSAIKWGSLKSLLGASERYAVIKAKPSVDDDMACGYMGGVVATHPHTTMHYWRPHMAIKQEEPTINQIKFEDGQISPIMKNTHLSGSPYMITKGFTFGTDVNSDRVNAVRCKYIIVQSIVNDLEALISTRTVLMSYQGMQKVKNVIKGTFKALIDAQIVDGLEYVRIPIETDLKNNTEAGQTARQQRRISAIEIGYIWNTSLEEIVITALINEAV